MIKNIADNKTIYQCASFDGIPLIPWFPNSMSAHNFIQCCRYRENPSVMFRDGMVSLHYYLVLIWIIF